MTTATASTDRDTPTRKPGRPRSARAHQAILAAALALLAEEGFEAMSMEGVAALAGVGKSTIYRRWASKEELLIEAVSSIHAEAPIVDTGNIRASAGYAQIEGYRAYRSWTAGFEDWYKLIKNLYIGQWSLTTVEQIIPVYAPSSDNNDVSAYISAVENAVDRWRSGQI